MRREFLLRILAAAVALYGAGLALPEVDPEIDTEEPFFDQSSRRQFRKQLGARLGPDFADDLAGIYFDINEGLFRVPQHAERIPAHVIWAWALAFEGDCGKHVVSAIARLHSMLFGADAPN